MGKKSRFKKPVTIQGSRLTVTEPINYDELPPIFSLQRVQLSKYCFSALNQQQKSAFAEAIFKRRNLSWQEIKKQHRHALGFEKIARNSLKVAVPKFITDDVEHFLAFRFDGLKPMVGYRQKNVFFVLWFDHDFTLYSH